MKLLLKMLVVYLFLSLANNAFAEKIQLEKSTLSEFAQVVSDYLEKPIIVSHDLKIPFSINANFDDKEKLKELFKMSVVTAGLEYEENNAAIIVSEKIKKPEVDTTIIRDVIIYSFKNASALQNVVVLKSSFPNISIIDSPANNSLIITASKAEHQNIKKIIQALDYSAKQVLIEAVISELSDSDYQGLDKNLENYSRLNNVIDSTVPYALTNPFTPLATFGMKLLTSKSLRFFLDWIKTSDSSVVLSRPKIVTLDRKQAMIMVGQNVPFITGKTTSAASNTTTPFQTIERHDIGLKLQVTPVILANGLVELSILQESSSVDMSTQASDIITNKRALTSTALIKNGDTLLIGGLSSSNSSSGHTSTIPEDIPMLSWFFSGDKKNESNSNLIILITVKILEMEV